MNRTIPLVIAVWIFGVSLGAAATIPAGTVLMARTAEPVSSHERAGAPFKAELEQDVVVKGKVLLRGDASHRRGRDLAGNSALLKRTDREFEGNLDKRTQRSGSYNRRLQAR